MKHILLLIAGLIICSVQAFAQSSYMIDPSDTLRASLSYPDFRDKHYIYFYNRTEGDLRLSWKVVSLDSPPGWDLMICDKTQCQDLGPTSQRTMSAIPKDESEYLAITPLSHGIPGTATIQVALRDNINPSEEHVIAWILEYAEQADVAGSTSMNILSVYPNPSSQEIRLSEPVVGEISIVDMKGVTLIEKDMRGSNTIDVSKLAPGEYVLRFPAGDGIGHMKFIKQ